MLPLHQAKQDMKRRMLRRMPQAGSFSTPLEAVMVHRRDEVEKPRYCFYKPMIVYMLQGRKATAIGSDMFVFGEDELLVVGIDMPSTSNIVEASPKLPCMAFNVGLDMNLIGELSTKLPWSMSSDDSPSKSMMLQPIDAEMLDALLRLDTVLDRPDELPVLGPMLVREIHFRLLLGPNGNYLRSLHSYGTQKGNVAQAVAWLRNNYKNPFRVECLAERVHMSESTFHRRFKEVTTLSPLQYQKRLRLQEAQRLMIAEDLGITEACDAVGYDSVAQFNREYKRLFGEPPRRDVLRWKDMYYRTVPLAMAE